MLKSRAKYLGSIFNTYNSLTIGDNYSIRMCEFFSNQLEKGLILISVYFNSHVIQQHHYHNIDKVFEDWEFVNVISISNGIGDEVRNLYIMEKQLMDIVNRNIKINKILK
jgi:hypothetical protein